MAPADMDQAVEAARLAVGLPVGSRIVAAMSGGVDSTVVAALLHKAGYDVVGVTLQLYDHGAALKKKGACCAGQDIHDARLAAEMLGIPHYVLDYESRFRDAVIDQFADSYLAGQTPVPCIRCNQTVKFRDLLDVARDLGAAAMATGHYVGRAVGPDGRAQMRKAIDPRATSPTSCSPPPRPSSTICASRWRAWKSPRCAASPPNWACASPPSPTARTSASCRPATIGP
jgi:tRNA-specific 2-thiouridylase